jgi:hypothetical protein
MSAADLAREPVQSECLASRTGRPRLVGVKALLDGPAMKSALNRVSGMT